MLRLSNRKGITELERFRVFNKILMRILLLLVTAFAFWLQLEFGFLEVLWRRIF